MAHALAAFVLAAFSIWPRFAQADDCKALHGLIVEGTGQTEDTAEEMFQHITAQWADSFADLSDSVSILPATNRGTHLMRPDQKKLKALSELIHQTPAGEMCSGDVIPYAFMKMAVGKTNETVKVETDSLLSYRLGEREVARRPNVNVEQSITLHQDRGNIEGGGDTGGTTPRVPGSPGNPGLFGGGEPPPEPRKGFDQSELLAQVRARKARCGDKADQVVMIQMISHGRQDCTFMVNFDQRLKAADLQKQLIEPLAAEGVKVVMNFGNCYGGCFVDQLKDMKVPGGACFTSSSRANTVAYGADGIIGRTYDETYPDYLKQLKNPLKAHLCATLWDPLNESQAQGVQPTSRARSRNLTDHRGQTAAEVGRKLGFPELAQECKAPKDGAFRLLPGIPEEKIKAIFSCPLVKKGFEDSGVGGNMDVFFGSVMDPNTAPGLEALRKLAANPEALANLKSGCDLDLKAYAPSPAERGGRGGGGVPSGASERQSNPRGTR